MPPRSLAQVRAVLLAALICTQHAMSSPGPYHTRLAGTEVSLLVTSDAHIPETLVGGTENSYAGSASVGEASSSGILLRGICGVFSSNI